MRKDIYYKSIFRDMRKHFIMLFNNQLTSKATYSSRIDSLISYLNKKYGVNKTENIIEFLNQWIYPQKSKFSPDSDL